jgi:hypothetical protein
MFCAEVFPNRIRMLCMVMTTCMQWLAQFMVVYSLPYMVVSIKSYTFIFFGICTLVAFVFTYLFVPETKGLLLEDMDILFAIKGLATRQNRVFAEEVSHRAEVTQEGNVDVLARKEQLHSSSSEDDAAYSKAEGKFDQPEYRTSDA